MPTKSRSQVSKRAAAATPTATAAAKAVDAAAARQRAPRVVLSPVGIYAPLFDCWRATAWVGVDKFRCRRRGFATAPDNAGIVVNTSRLALAEPKPNPRVSRQPSVWY